MQLRDYQREALDALYASWRAKRIRNPILVGPTGCGKSAMIAGLIAEAMQTYPRTRIIVATHRPELVGQNHAQILRFWPQAPSGIYAAKMKRREIRPVTVALIQSIHRRAYEFQACDLLIIDECHLLSPKADSVYGRFIADCLKINPHMRVVGFTATDYRLDSGLLTEPYGDRPPIFDGVAHRIPMLKLIEQGHLVPLIPYAGKREAARLDVSNVGRRGGDFISGELQAAVNTDEINRAIAAEVAEAAHGRKKGMGFAAGVDHARGLAEALREHGISAAAAWGDMGDEARAAVLRAHRSGEIKCITNCDLLTTGFDDPEIDFMFCARPTESAGLWVQICGRGMRPSPGKTDCLVLDFAGNSFRHGPIDLIEGRSKRAPKERGAAPCKECPECQLIVPAGTRHCECGHEFEIERETKLATTASDAALLSTFEKPTWMPVRGVEYSAYETRSGSMALKVDYDVGMLLSISEYVNIEHDSIGARNAARGWWFKRANKHGFPETVKAALADKDCLAVPSRIQVIRNGKYVNIVSFDLTRELAHA